MIGGAFDCEWMVDCGLVCCEFECRCVVEWWWIWIWFGCGFMVDLNVNGRLIGGAIVVDLNIDWLWFGSGLGSVCVVDWWWI